VLVEIDGREVRTERDVHSVLDQALDFGPERRVVLRSTPT
jgi:hypothetical protein